MKTSFLILTVMVLFASISIADLTFSVKVQGAEQKNVLADGLKSSELAQLTIDSNDENVNVLEFEIIHALGKSPLNSAIVTQGNIFDLNKLRDQAKAGDRIVINVTKITGYDNKLSKKNSILRIPIR
jgi:light-regulated signal transduction histidine kinase (bacteriophytochrome)